MTELTIRPEEIRDALERFVVSYEAPEASKDEVGAVRVIGDGIARVEGLPSAMTNELLKFADGTLSMSASKQPTSASQVAPLQDFLHRARLRPPP